MDENGDNNFIWNKPDLEKHCIFSKCMKYLYENAINKTYYFIC